MDGYVRGVEKTGREIDLPYSLKPRKARGTIKNIVDRVINSFRLGEWPDGYHPQTIEHITGGERIYIGEKRRLITNDEKAAHGIPSTAQNAEADVLIGRIEITQYDDEFVAITCYPKTPGMAGLFYRMVDVWTTPGGIVNETQPGGDTPLTGVDRKTSAEPWRQSRPNKRERDKTIWESRKNGCTWEEVAEAAKCGVTTAREVYARLKKRLQSD